jgi:hypothetical protein
VILGLSAEMDLPQQLLLIVKMEKNVQLEDTVGLDHNSLNYALQELSTIKPKNHRGPIVSLALQENSVLAQLNLPSTLILQLK